MQKWGPKRAVFLNVLLAQIIIGVFFWGLFQASFWNQLLAIPFILAVILIQGAVALNNAKQQSNPLSRLVHRLYIYFWKRR